MMDDKKGVRRQKSRQEEYEMARRGENIYKRGDGRWEGRYIRGRTPEGRAQYGYVYAATYSACRENGGSVCGSCPVRSRQAIT